ncbi:MAG: hypothetical protein F8N37_08985 [Telmatospirillum sp.]|nr:hypothetical protein [Telmatospirillum sp.]
MQPELKKNELITEIISAIRQGKNDSTRLLEVQEFETVIRAMGELLTSEQRARLKADRAVASLLEQDRTRPTINAFCGTLGGFGTEELEAWERARVH